MSDLMPEAERNLSELRENPYPGRGLVVGVNALGDTALQVYWLMGRGENSRNRVLLEKEDVVSTAPYDLAKVEDPSLIIYNAMRISTRGDVHVVSNGDQTDTAVDYINVDDAQRKEASDPGRAFEAALGTRTYEPDGPNFTPRITGFTRVTPEGDAAFRIHIIRKAQLGDSTERDVWRGELLEANTSEPGIGSAVHTYMGDGDPLPSFEGRPIALPLGEGVEDTAKMFWEHLSPDNRVAIIVKGIVLDTREASYHIINAHG